MNYYQTFCKYFRLFRFLSSTEKRKINNEILRWNKQFNFLPISMLARWVHNTAIVKGNDNPWKCKNTVFTIDSLQWKKKTVWNTYLKIYIVYHHPFNWICLFVFVAILWERTTWNSLKLEIILVSHFLWLFVAIQWRRYFYCCKRLHSLSCYVVISFRSVQVSKLKKMKIQMKKITHSFMENPKSLKSTSPRRITELCNLKATQKSDGKSPTRCIGWIHQNAPYVAVKTFPHSVRFGVWFCLISYILFAVEYQWEVNCYATEFGVMPTEFSIFSLQYTSWVALRIFSTCICSGAWCCWFLWNFVIISHQYTNN